MIKFPRPDDRIPEPSPQALGGGAAEPPAPIAAPAPPVPIAAVKKTRKHRKSKPVPQGPPFTPWPSGSPLDFVELSNSSPLAVGSHQISVRSSCGTHARLLGVELSNRSKGVIYDTDGVNGARVADLEKPLPALRAALLKRAEPSFIIVSLRHQRHRDEGLFRPANMKSERVPDSDQAQAGCRRRVNFGDRSLRPRQPAQENPRPDSGWTDCLATRHPKGGAACRMRLLGSAGCHGRVRFHGALGAGGPGELRLRALHRIRDTRSWPTCFTTS